MPLPKSPGWPARLLPVLLLVPLPPLTFMPLWAAQPPVEATSESDWNNLQQLRAGQKITVVQTDLKRVKGRFLSFTEETITLRVKEKEIAVHREDVLRVSSREQNRRRRNALIGMAIGGGIGLAVGAREDKKSGESGEHVAAFVLGFLGVGIGAGVGAAVPSHPTIYRARKQIRNQPQAEAANRATTETPAASSLPSAAGAASDTLASHLKTTSWRFNPERAIRELAQQAKTR